MKRLFIVLTSLLIPIAFASACGPAKSSQAIWKARGAIKRAQAAQAPEHSPYELALAEEYYHKAREEAGFSKYEVAEQLAKQAEIYAKTAAGEPVPTPDPREVDPDEEMP